MSLCAIRPCQNEVASDKTFGSGSLEGVNCVNDTSEKAISRH